MLKHILIIAAPFGFGPSSKALILAEYLRDRYQVSISSTGNSVKYLQANASDDIDIVPGLFRTTFPTRESLAGFHAFIAVNQMPALQHLETLGLAERSVFVESIAQWRAESAPGGLPENIFAHIVQDEFREATPDRMHSAANTVVTAPLLWPDVDRLGRDERQGVVVHTGGMASPVTQVELAESVISGLITPLAESLIGGGHQVTLLGNTDVFRRIAPSRGMNVLGSVSPATAIKAIGGAKLLITTPGIGAVYEAMSKRTPIILLPPTNSTQLKHYRTLTSLGIVGVLGDRLRDVLSNRLASLPWQHQANALMRTLVENSGDIERMAVSVLTSILASDDGARLEDCAAKGDALWSSLSRVSPREAVVKTLDHLL